ncbi:unnamed protein product, partial [Closterium sp. Naga37s-1]
PAPASPTSGTTVSAKALQAGVLSFPRAAESSGNLQAVGQPAHCWVAPCLCLPYGRAAGKRGVHSPGGIHPLWPASIPCRPCSHTDQRSLISTLG